MSPTSSEGAAGALARRNRQLATMLDTTVTELKKLAAQTAQAESLADETARIAHRNAIETAAARV
ncbi:hypothetical protein GGTG_07359 [Gaeumannomyces tritici R3-111a-1]|uniref:Uncharacterized protein n=1 Tax=Gaeumannomyces tritici (strain R3-111a-1) TaxID=644352 RepID=J3P1G2_GAET3|nr:hypothetical protein GGTG_07359 [Gaeumannomyces tritici R3-111a-1]EJT77447.1 hypothetical protein GGTG_07359 [Gaeumannomyces tritici R3-111a-1]